MPVNFVDEQDWNLEFIRNEAMENHSSTVLKRVLHCQLLSFGCSKVIKLMHRHWCMQAFQLQAFQLQICDQIAVMCKLYARFINLNHSNLQ